MNNFFQSYKRLITPTLLSIILLLGYSDHSRAYQLLDPTPGQNDHFGENMLMLSNGNLLVFEGDYEYYKSIHLYAPQRRKPLASFYGGNANQGGMNIELLGNGNFVLILRDQRNSKYVARLIDGLTGKRLGERLLEKKRSTVNNAIHAIPLANNNFVIFSTYISENGNRETGSARLFNGMTGEPIGDPIIADGSGNSYPDHVNSYVTALVNGNFVVNFRRDDVNNITDAGSVRLFNGMTGELIGKPITGNSQGDFIRSHVTTLPNGNFVIVLPYEDQNGRNNIGSIKLVDGSTCEVIGEPLIGNRGLDYSDVTITILPNNNYVVVAPNYDKGRVIQDIGLVVLVNGITGKLIGEPLVGNNSYDRIGSGGIAVLPNNNVVVLSPFDDVSGIRDVGSGRLVNSTTGNVIGEAIVGDQIDDFLEGKVTVLPNSNFVLSLPLDDIGALKDAGSVRLVDGSTGEVIGNLIEGNHWKDNIGEGVKALPNNNYVVASPKNNVRGFKKAGSVLLMNGNNGERIRRFVGRSAYNYIGNGITVLPNNNFVITFSGNNVSVGSVRLINGSSGIEINNFKGQNLGSLVTALPNNIFVVVSAYENVPGDYDGTIRFFDAITGEVIRTIKGDKGSNAYARSDIISLLQDGLYVIGMGNSHNNDISFSGKVRVIRLNRP